jgi:hypothetical protein
MAVLFQIEDRDPNLGSASAPAAPEVAIARGPRPAEIELLAPAPAFVLQNHSPGRNGYFDAGYRLACAEIAIPRGYEITYEYLVASFEANQMLMREMLVFFGLLHKKPYVPREPAFVEDHDECDLIESFLGGYQLARVIHLGVDARIFDRFVDDEFLCFELFLAALKAAWSRDRMENFVDYLCELDDGDMYAIAIYDLVTSGIFVPDVRVFAYREGHAWTPWMRSAFMASLDAGMTVTARDLFALITDIRDDDMCAYVQFVIEATKTIMPLKVVQDDIAHIIADVYSSSEIDNFVDLLCVNDVEPCPEAVRLLKWEPRFVRQVLPRWVLAGLKIELDPDLFAPVPGAMVSASSSLHLCKYLATIQESRSAFIEIVPELLLNGADPRLIYEVGDDAVKEIVRRFLRFRHRARKAASAMMTPLHAEIVAKIVAMADVPNCRFL